MGVCFCVGEVGFGKVGRSCVCVCVMPHTHIAFHCRQERQADVFYPTDQLSLSK